MENWFFPIIVAILAFNLFVLAWDWSKYKQVAGPVLMAGISFSWFDWWGMKARKSDPQLVVNNLVRLQQDGLDVGRRQLESAYLQGALAAKGRDLKLSLKELVAADLEDQLAEALGLDARSRESR